MPFLCLTSCSVQLNTASVKNRPGMYFKHSGVEIHFWDASETRIWWNHKPSGHDQLRRPPHSQNRTQTCPVGSSRKTCMLGEKVEIPHTCKCVCVLRIQCASNELGLAAVAIECINAFTLTVMEKCSPLWVSRWCTHNGQKVECGMLVIKKTTKKKCSKVAIVISS